MSHDVVKGGSSVRTELLAGAMLCTLLAGAAFAADANYKIVQRIKVPDGGFDYATFDSATGRVLMARTDFTTVIDVRCWLSRPDGRRIA